MITIVMPIYNTGVYLKESIESILNQSYTNFELICVDDGSKDVVTLELLEFYEKIDDRIQIIHLPKNVGAAEARNMGLKQAKGEYIIFLDADDWFDENMLDKMYTSLENSGVDMCVCGYRVYSEQNKRIVAENTLRHVKGITDRVFQVKELGEDGLLSWALAPWSKMCRMDFLKKNNIYFQNLSSSNDVYYSLMCNLHAQKIVYCDGGNAFITYRTDNRNQISARRVPINFWCAIQKVLKERERNISDLEWRQIVYVLVTYIGNELKVSIDEQKTRECYDFVRVFLKENRNRLYFEHRIINNYITLFLEKEYEMKWFKKIGDFECQFEENHDILMKLLETNEKKNIVIWGNGMRSQAFQHYCREMGLGINAQVVDKKNDAVGTVTSDGFFVLHTSEVIEVADVIIASNYEIYRELTKELGDRNIELINLESLCPMG